MAGKTNADLVNRHGDFIWYELLTTDLDGAKAFYGGLLGWSFRTENSAGVDYTLISAGDVEIAGIFAITEEMAQGGARPLWTGYITVDDADKAAEAVAAKDGAVLMPAMDIPEVGRIAFLADPQGAPFYVMKPCSDAPASPSFAAYEPREGHCAWNELVTADQDAAQDWYGTLFGFVQIDSFDMGPMGEYRIMQNAGQDFAFGAFMQKPQAMPVSLWTYYFRVPDIDVAVDYIGANGGQVINGPNEIPGGDFVLNAMDSQGAPLALIGKRN